MPKLGYLSKIILVNMPVVKDNLWSIYMIFDNDQ